MTDSAKPPPPVDIVAVEPLTSRSADIVHTIALAGGMKPYAWSMNGENWPQVKPLMLETGQRIEIDLVNDSMMAHPMHLHGHTFNVIGTDGQPIPGAVRATVLVMPMGL